MKYIAVGYYTLGTIYEKECDPWRESLESFSLPYDLVGVHDQGSWIQNVQYKPYFLLQMLNKHFPKDLLYIDVDARVRKHPVIFDKVDYDLGVHYLDRQDLCSGRRCIFPITPRFIY